MRHKILFGVLGAMLLVTLGIGIGIAILLSGVMSTAATQQHARLTHWLLETGLVYSVRANADSIIAPSLVGDPAMIRRGLSCYRAHCIDCHGAPGIAPGKQGRGMMPVPSNLAQSARDWPPEWLYYVTKSGVRMTGMPAWEYRLSEDDLWSTVAFLKTLPGLERAEYQALSATVAAPACESGTDDPASADDAYPRMSVAGREHAEIVLRQYACHSCHRIGGLVGPEISVGPPLVDWPDRKYIAGVLPNTRDNLVRWIVDPQRFSPQSLMPDMDVPEAHAREMAAYLFIQE